jgi:hypothetical protein
MAGAYPIYYGAPNIYDYFDKDSITPIDIRYPKSTFALIEKLIAENTYEKAKPKILEAKNLILDKYNIYNMMAEIVERDGNIIRKKELITIKNWQYFWDKNLNQLKKDKKSLPKRIFRSLTKKANKLKLLIVDHYLLLKLKYSKK